MMTYYEHIIKGIEEKRKEMTYNHDLRDRHGCDYCHLQRKSNTQVNAIVNSIKKQTELKDLAC
jgi:hypothetical protein